MRLDTISKIFIGSGIVLCLYAVFLYVFEYPPLQQNQYINMYFTIVAFVSALEFTIIILKNDKEHFGILAEYKNHLLIASVYLIYFTLSILSSYLP